MKMKLLFETVILSVKFKFRGQSATEFSDSFFFISHDSWLELENHELKDDTVS